MNGYFLPGLWVCERELSVPLDWRATNSAQIRVFWREVTSAANKNKADLPLLLFLQGGPGGKSPYPSLSVAWLQEAVQDYRVILLDQRGTGRSSPVAARLMASMSPEAGRDYLLNFRADSIVRDCEAIRKQVYGGEKWETLGQSFGGFITLSYLSFAPEGLAACYLTGGLAAITHTADELYRRTYAQVAAKNQQFFDLFPQDKVILRSITDILRAQEIRLPDGDRLTVKRLQHLGIRFGMLPGFEQIHWLLDSAFAGSDGDRLSDTFLEAVMQQTSFASNPLYAVLQESIYAQGKQVTAWAAERVRAEFSEFSEDATDVFFTGEMIYSWMFEEIKSLHGFTPAANALATFDNYPPLYDISALQQNTVPVAAAVYYHDMYVPREYALETARLVKGCKTWITSEYEHDGLRQSPAVFQHLKRLVHAHYTH